MNFLKLFLTVGRRERREKEGEKKKKIRIKHSNRGKKRKLMFKMKRRKLIRRMDMPATRSRSCLLFPLQAWWCIGEIAL